MRVQNINSINRDASFKAQVKIFKVTPESLMTPEEMAEIRQLAQNYGKPEDAIAVIVKAFRKGDAYTRGCNGQTYLRPHDGYDALVISKEHSLVPITAETSLDKPNPRPVDALKSILNFMIKGKSLDDFS